MATPAGEPDDAARAARLAVGVVFLLQGLGAGNWFVRIPAVQAKLGLSAGLLGFSLLGIAAGSLLSMPLTGWAVTRVGSRPLVRVAVVSSMLALALPGLAPLPLLLLPALVVYGITAGMLDVSMNVQAVAVELRYPRPLLSSFHAMYSIGGLLGAVLGGAVAALGIGPAAHLVTLGVVLALVGLVATRRLLPARTEVRASGPAFARPSRALAALGVIALCALLCEGAMGDWSALYLDGTLGTGAGLAAAGYAAFSLAMAGGRLVGDRLSLRLGPPRLLRLAGLLVLAGLGAGLLLGDVPAALVGFAATGAGLSAVFPITVSLAGGGRGEANPGPAIAAVSTTGYLGFLAGPPLIGLLAGQSSLRLALGVVPLLGGVISLLGGTLRKR
ncbi:MAG TPA: MFS transporter [Thermomicrobiaceae bacterium]|nr:MFS transporter [Thermomicrobiaceae bacterium]